MSPESVPQSHCTDHLLEPAQSEEGEKGEPADNEKDVTGKKEGEGGSKKSSGGLVIFAVDISGSMCSTTEVPALQGTVYNRKIIWWFDDCPNVPNWQFKCCLAL